MTATYFDVIHRQNALDALVSRRDAFQDAVDQIVALEDQLAPVLRQITGLGNPDCDLPQSEKITKVRDLQETEAIIRKKIAAAQMGHGAKVYMEDVLSHIHPRIETASMELDKAMGEYAATSKKRKHLDATLKTTRSHARKIDALMGELGHELAAFWQSHETLRTEAKVAGATEKMGYGVSLNSQTVDGILQAMLWKIAPRSLNPTRPGPGVLDKTLSTLLPEIAAQFLGEPGPKKAPDDAPWDEGEAA